MAPKEGSMRRSIRVRNTSEWPTWLVRWLVREAAKSAGVRWKYEWVMQGTRRKTWHGYGGKYEGFGRVCRRYFDKVQPGEFQEMKYAGGRMFKRDPVEFRVPRTPVALLAHLIRHELEHAADGNPARFRRANGKVDVRAMEELCEMAAEDFVDGLRRRWPEVRAEWKAAARKARLAERPVAA